MSAIEPAAEHKDAAAAVDETAAITLALLANRRGRSTHAHRLAKGSRTRAVRSDRPVINRARYEIWALLQHAHRVE